MAVFAQGLFATAGARMMGAATLCAGGKLHMRRLMETIASGRLDTRPLVTHRFSLDQIIETYELFTTQRDGVLKAAITA